MSNFQLAQLNIARMLVSAESPQLADFFVSIDRINALADTAPGFIWRLQDEAGSATSFRPYGEDMLVNMSVWETIESLHDYVYRSAHIEIMRRRKQWFEHMQQAYTVLWWISAGSVPTLEQAQERLALLQGSGPTPRAFTFKQPFAPPGEVDAASVEGFDDTCPAT